MGTSAQGIDCGDWIHQLRHGQISPGLTMDDFWRDAEVITTEYTMVSRKRSLGGQLDLLVKFGEPPGWWISRPAPPVTEA